MIESEVIIHCFHMYCKKPCVNHIVSSCIKAFSYFYIRVVHSENILFCISQFVSSFFKPFWSILHASSFHFLFSHTSFLSSVHLFPLMRLFCVYVVYFISGFHFRISCRWFVICFYVFFLLCRMLKSCLKVQAIL